MVAETRESGSKIWRWVAVAGIQARARRRPDTHRLLQLTPTKSGVRQIVGLDAIRFLAAALVMGFHLAFWIWASSLTILG